ncbi:hypothetical protein C8F01DRAFT_281476, partial [Mycena amicta]
MYMEQVSGELGLDVDATKTLDILQRFKATASANTPILDAAILDFERAALLYPLDDPDRARALNRLADALLLRAIIARNPKLEDMQRGVGFRAGAELRYPVDHLFVLRTGSQHDFTIVTPEKTRESATKLLHSASDSLANFVALQREPASLLDDVVRILTAALTTPSTLSPWDRTKPMFALATTLLILADLDPDPSRCAAYRADAILRMREVAGRTTSRQICLASALATLTSNNEKDLREAIDLIQRCTQTDLEALHFAQSGQDIFRSVTQSTEIASDALDKAIADLTAAEFLLSYGHKHRKSILHQLGGSLASRFELLHKQDDLRLAIEHLRESIELHPRDDPNRRATVSNLATALQKWFSLHGELRDIDEAIQLSREALSLYAPAHRYRGSALGTLAAGLEMRFSATRQVRDIDEAVQLRRRALQLHAFPHPECDTSLENLASVLRARFDHDGPGNVSDVQEASRYLKEALILRPVQHPKRFDTLCRLCSSLQLEYTVTRDVRRLDEAVSSAREALSLCPTDSESRSSVLLNLTSSLLLRLEHHTKTPLFSAKDLQECIVLLEENLQTTNFSAELAVALTLRDLGVAFELRFENGGRLEDLNRAMQLFRKGEKICSQVAFFPYDARR